MSVARIRVWSSLGELRLSVKVLGEFDEAASFTAAALAQLLTCYPMGGRGRVIASECGRYELLVGASSGERHLTLWFSALRTGLTCVATLAAEDAGRLFIECDLSMLAHSPEPQDHRPMCRTLADRVERIRAELGTEDE